MKYLQKGVDSMIAAGQCPPGTVIDGVRVRYVEFLIKNPQGQYPVMGAEIRPESEPTPADYHRAPAGKQ